MKFEGPEKGSAGASRCPDVRRWLQVFLDDEIQDEAMVMRLAVHLDLCPKCGAEARTLSQLKDCLRRLQPPADREALGRLERFVESLQAAEQPPQAR